MPFYDQPSRRTPHDVRKSVRLFYWLAWAVLYLGVPTRLYNGDVLNLYWRLRTAHWHELFNPNAMLWAPVLDLWVHWARALGFHRFPGQELFFCQCLNSLVALLLLASVYRWSRLLGARTSVAFTVAGFVGANFTCWHWGTDVNPYLLLTLFGTWAVWSAWSYATSWHKDRLYWSAVFFACALLIHLLAIVLVVPQWYAIWSRQEHPVKRKLLAWGVHFAITAALVGGPYLYVSEVLYRDRPQGGIVNFLRAGSAREDRWALARYEDPPPEWPSSIAIGHFNLAWYSDAPEVYYTYRKPKSQAIFDSVWMNRVLPYLWLLNTILAVIALFPTVRLLREGEPGRNLALFLLWTTPSFLIIGAVNPALGYLRLIYLPAMALLVGLWITLSPQTRKRPIQALVLVMLAWNFFEGILPHSVYGQVPAYAQAVAWRSDLGPQDLVVLTPEQDYLGRHVRAFAGPERALVGNMATLIQRPPGVTPLQFGTLDGTTLDDLFAGIYIERALFEEFDARGGLRFAALRPPGNTEVDLLLLRRTWEPVAELAGEHAGVGLVRIAPQSPVY
ncbi:MAG TPA: hypothetical protein VEI97_18470 [bacterium]|nr:hypothetical protein [bacterium]